MAREPQRIQPLACNSSHLSESPGELATPGHLSHTCPEAPMRLGRGGGSAVLGLEAPRATLAAARLSSGGLKREVGTRHGPTQLTSPENPAPLLGPGDQVARAGGLGPCRPKRSTRVLRGFPGVRGQGSGDRCRPAARVQGAHSVSEAGGFLSTRSSSRISGGAAASGLPGERGNLGSGSSVRAPRLADEGRAFVPGLAQGVSTSIISVNFAAPLESR